MDEDLRRLLDSDDPALDRELKRLALGITLCLLFLLLAVVVIVEWVTR